MNDNSRKVKQHVRRPGDKRAGSILVRASIVAHVVKSLPWMQETWVWSMGWEDPLEKRMATHSSILSWRIPWTEEPGGLQSMELQKVRHDWVTNIHKHISRIQRNPVWQAWWGVGITYLSELPFCTFNILNLWTFNSVLVKWIRLGLTADTPYKLVDKKKNWMYTRTKALNIFLKW